MLSGSSTRCGSWWRSGCTGLALGYEDLNDHDELRRDAMLAVLAEKEEPTGEGRVGERERGKALAGGYP